MGRVPVADAVLYLLRHTHSADLRFLESFHDDEVAEGTPVNTVGVLSRADEIGCARLDAMEVAERVARRYETDSRLHRLCPVVVPVNGLLGHAAATLREDEYAALAAVARAPQELIGDLLLTADRFAIGREQPGAGRRAGAAARPARPVRRTPVRGAGAHRRRRRPRPSSSSRLTDVSGLGAAARGRAAPVRRASPGAQGQVGGRRAARDLPAGRLRRRPGPAAAASSRSRRERTSSRRSGSCSSSAAASSP